MKIVTIKTVFFLRIQYYLYTKINGVYEKTSLQKLPQKFPRGKLAAWKIRRKKTRLTKNTSQRKLAVMKNGRKKLRRKKKWPHLQNKIRIFLCDTMS